MSVREKFDEGKHFTWSQSGTWEVRCTGAELRQNLGPEWGLVAWKRATGEDGNPVFSTAGHSHAKQVEKNRNRRRETEEKNKKYNDDSLQACSDYSCHDDDSDVCDIHHWTLPATDFYKTNVSVSTAKSLELEVATRDQRTADDIAVTLWMTERREWQYHHVER